MHIVCHHNTHTCKWLLSFLVLFSPSTVDFLPNSTVCPHAWSVHRTLSHRMFITCYYFPIDCNRAWQGRWIACLHVDEGAAKLESTTVYRYIHVCAWCFCVLTRKMLFWFYFKTLKKKLAYKNYWHIKCSEMCTFVCMNKMILWKMLEWNIDW